MAKKNMKAKVEQNSKSPMLPGHKDTECQNKGRDWLIAKEEFCAARDKIQKAADALSVQMRKDSIKTFVCEDTRITLKVIEEQVKVVSSSVEE